MISVIGPRSFGNYGAGSNYTGAERFSETEPASDRAPLMSPKTEPDAQRLQRHAVEALTDVKAWVWQQHSGFLAGPGPFRREQAEGYAALPRVFLEARCRGTHARPGERRRD